MRQIMTFVRALCALIANSYRSSFEAIEDYIKVTNRRVTFEYIMLNEVNDGVEQAQELADLTKNIRKLSYINLIPYNPVSEHDQYSRSTKERTLAFFDVLKKMVLTVSFVRNMVQILMLPVVNCAQYAQERP